MWLVDLLGCLLVSCHSDEIDYGFQNMSSGTNTSTPLVTWHGVNDDADSCAGVIGAVRRAVPGIYVRNVIIGENLVEDKHNSVFMKMRDQVAYVCEMIKTDSNLADGYNAIGISQGGLLFRGLAELCPNPPMRTLVTVGSPHQGVYGLPRCRNKSDTFCQMVRKLLSMGAYIPWIQDLIAPAQYWHDPLATEKYKKGSHFLSEINNEIVEKHEAYKDNLANLDNFVMIKWKNDTFVKPKESCHFQFYSPGQDKEILPLSESTIYQEDWIGLKVLDGKGNLHFLEMEGDHMDFDSDWFYQNVVLTYLKK